MKRATPELDIAATLLATGPRDLGCQRNPSRSSRRINRNATVARTVVVMLLGLLTGCPQPLAETGQIQTRVRADADSLKAGVAVREITPQQPIFLAGGLPFQVSNGVHDHLTARALVLESGNARIALIALDLIGIDADDVALLRTQILQETRIDYALVAATHTHNGPDVIGAWNPLPFPYQTDYVNNLATTVGDAVAEAAAALKPVRLKVAQGSSGPPELVRDTRPPEQIPDTITAWQLVDVTDNNNVATVVHFASHPITVPTLNAAISCDWVHPMRTAIESGFATADTEMRAVGGTCLYFNGALGGRLTPRRERSELGLDEPDPAFQRARAYGRTLALRVADVLTNATDVGHVHTLEVNAQRVDVALDNPLLRVGADIGAIKRPVVAGRAISEVAVVRVGPIELFAIPGMAFPEMTWAGPPTEIVPGADLPNASREQPLEELARGDIFVPVGLANDMLGYLIPKRQWDAIPPFISDEPPYGELVSAGPDAAATIVNAFRALLHD